MGMCFVRIVYDDNSQTGYEKIEISRDDSVVASFGAGDPIIDWIDMQKWLTLNDVHQIMNTSSVDHFFMDSDIYTNLYVDDENAALTTRQVNEGNVDTSGMAEFLVTHDIKTFEELRSYYKDYKDKNKENVEKETEKEKGV